MLRFKDKDIISNSVKGKTITSGQCILLVTLFFVIVQNALFYYQVWQVALASDIESVGFVFILPIILFALFTLLFNLIFWPVIGKLLCISLLFVATAVNYFIYSFNAVIDTEMIRNVMETNISEASALITPRLFIALAVMAVLPSIWLIRIRVTYRSFGKELRQRLLHILMAIVVALALASFFYKDFAPFFRNNRVLLKSVVPVNVIAGVKNYIEQQIAANQPFLDLGLDAKKGEALLQQPKKTLTILVLGETARAENFALNRYPRQTNPALSLRKDLVSYQQVSSCGTATATSVPCMFSRMTRETYDAVQAQNESSVLAILSRANVELLWRENDGGCKGVCRGLPYEEMTTSKSPLCSAEGCYDEILLDNLQSYIDKQENDTLIVLHQMGSHGPSYYQRYPDKYRKFTPTCDTNSIQNCSQEALENTYDNTIVYTDAVLDQVITLLENNSERFVTSMLYISDHGESLGSKGLYLHGAPYMLAPSQQTQVPLIMWMSPQYQRNHQINMDCLQQQASSNAYSHDNLFHTLLGMYDIKTTEYQPDLDMLKACRRQGQ